MTRLASGGPRAHADDHAVAVLIEELTARLQAGEAIDLEACCRAHPEHAARLRELLPALEMLAAVGGAPSSNPLPGEPLGDFQLLREVGRGGMGVVYEATQISLGRRVALKVLPFAATLDAKQLQRFRHEAQAAACLHHPNIVPVHGVGCARSVHYYAMQFIDGQSLARVIEEQRNHAQSAGVAHPAPPHTYTSARPGSETAARAAISTKHSIQQPAHFRAVAQLGIQAAEALEHAHERGVVHRDVKPANLLLDERGNLWITDFGLAHVQSDARLTLTGDLVGTLRYMSPEQALGRRGLLDHRTDVYSLGATLYELLTLEAALPGQDREELLRQAADSNVRPPRQLNRAVPAEVEIVVLKAMAREPADRYTTAQELADDLRRWLDGRPILARRPSLARRLTCWARRHRPLVAAAAAVLVAGLALAGLDVWRGWQHAIALEQAVAGDMRRAEDLQQEGRWAEALQALERAEGRLADDGPARLREEIERLRSDMALVAALEEARLQMLTLAAGDFDYAGAHLAYAQALREFGLDSTELDVEQIAEMVRASSIRTQIVAALDDWADIKDRLQPESGAALRALARRADADPWRQRLREATARRDLKDLRELAADGEVLKQSPANLVLLGFTLFDAGERDPAERLLRQAQRRSPANLWINFQLGSFLLARSTTAARAEAVGFFRAALAVRPTSSVLYNSLGSALRDASTLAESEAAFRQAIDLAPDSAKAYNNLGANLLAQHRLSEAVEALRRAIACQPDYAYAYTNLAAVLVEQGKPSEAEAACRRAVALRPDYAMGHYNLAGALSAQGKLTEAAAAVGEALRLQPDNPEAHRSLGGILTAQGKPAEAVVACRRALALKPDYAEAYSNLGVALQDQGKLPEAVDACRRAVDLKPDYAEAHNNLGTALGAQAKWADAISAFRRAVALKPTYVLAQDNLGRALAVQGKPAEAAEVYRKVVELAPDRHEAWRGLGLALASHGKTPEAIEAFRRAVAAKPDYAEAHGNLGTALASQGKLPEAIDAFRKAAEVQPNYVWAHCQLGLVYTQQGKLVEASAALRRAVAADPKFAEAHCNLGHVLYRQGRFADALEAMRRGHELGSRDPHWRLPSAKWVEQMERLAHLDELLPRVLKGDAQSKDAAERLELAEFCLAQKHRTADAVRLYAEAFAAQPGLSDDAQVGHRYNAACAAALAACEGDAAERARLRGQALAWLRAELAFLERRVEKEPERTRLALGKQFAHWQRDADLAGLRDPDALNRLSEIERSEWRQFWEQVEALRQRTEAPEKSQSRQ